jgi:hypothetical protein
MKPELTQARLKELLHYNPETGVFTWRVSGGRFQAGSRAGGVESSSGYRAIGVQRKNIREHRLAFLYMTGALPKFCVDHINGNRDDNRWENLRAATYSENAHNMKKSAPKSGVRGVYYHKYGFWCARVWLAGRVAYCKYFTSLDDAAQAVREARKNLHGSFASTDL